MLSIISKFPFSTFYIYVHPLATHSPLTFLHVARIPCTTASLAKRKQLQPSPKQCDVHVLACRTPNGPLPRLSSVDQQAGGMKGSCLDLREVLGDWGFLINKWVHVAYSHWILARYKTENWYDMRWWAFFDASVRCRKDGALQSLVWSILWHGGCHDPTGHEWIHGKAPGFHMILDRGFSLLQKDPKWSKVEPGNSGTPWPS